METEYTRSQIDVGPLFLSPEDDPTMNAKAVSPLRCSGIACFEGTLKWNSHLTLSFGIEKEVTMTVYQEEHAEGDFLRNLATVERVTSESTAQGCHFLVFPECFLSGYESRDAVEQGAHLDMFPEHPEASARGAVHVTLVGQMICPNGVEPNPDIESSETADDFRTLPLGSLVRMKLNSYRRKDQVHFLDMISFGLIDGSWPQRFPSELGMRLQRLLDDPDGGQRLP